jgi:hypothetical protein
MTNYVSDRNRHLSTLREIARDGTVEMGAFKGALRWAIHRLEGLPEHWVATEEREAAIEAGAEELAESQRLRAALVAIRGLSQHYASESMAAVYEIAYNATMWQGHEPTR